MACNACIICDKWQSKSTLLTLLSFGLILLREVKEKGNNGFSFSLTVQALSSSSLLFWMASMSEQSLASMVKRSYGEFEDSTTKIGSLQVFKGNKTMLLSLLFSWPIPIFKLRENGVLLLYSS